MGLRALLTNWIPVSLALNTAAVQGEDRCFRIQGDLTSTSFKQDGSLLSNFSREFKIRLTPDKWYIEVKYGPNWYSQIVGFETNIYEVLYDPKADEEWPLPANVCPGLYPRNQYDFVTVPWLAFCSHQFFSVEKWAEMPTPWHHALSEPQANFCTAEVVFLPGSLRLPQTISYLTSRTRMKSAARSSYLRVETLSEKERIRRMVDYGSIYPENTKLGEYRILNVTNVFGVTIPLLFELRQYALRARPTQEIEIHREEKSTFLSAVHVGVVESVQVREEDFVLPRLLKSASVADYRLHDRPLKIDLVQYTVTNGVWITGVNQELLGLLNVKRKEAIRKNLILRLKRGVVVGAMVTVSLVPCFAYWKLRRSRKAKQTN